MEFQLSYFKSWKMMLWGCCTQYVRKFRKLSSGHRTGKGQFSFKSQRKATPKNAPTTAQLHSSHMLVKQCSKFSKPGFSSTWAMNFQMFNPVLEKAEEPQIKLPISTGSWKKQESSRKTSISALFTVPKPLTVWITINCGKFWERWEYQNHLTCLLKNLCASQEATVRTGHGTTDWFQIGKGVHQGCILSPCLFNLYAEYIMQNARLDETKAGNKIAGRNINNLRYADDTILMARKWRGTKQPLDVGKRGKWKRCLKTQQSENEDHGIRSHHFMTNRWGNSGNSDRLYLGGLQNHCGWWL